MIIVCDDVVNELVDISKYYSDPNSLNQELILDPSTDLVLSTLWKIAEKQSNFTKAVVTE